MYWQDKYSSPGQAVTALKEVLAGKRKMTAAELHIAHVASRAGLSGISEDPNNLGVICELTEQPHNLGSLKSFFKKVVKTATKLSPSHQIAKALKIDAFSPSHILVNKLTATPASSPKTPPAAIAEAPATQVLPLAPPQPIPQLPDLTGNSPMSFNISSGGGGSAPAPVPGEAVAESWLTPPVMIGMGVGALALLFLLLRKKR